MANKEYQMLFRLGAKLGDNFNGTFSSAQKVLQTMQKEVQAFNKLQSDVNAYQRQQEGIAKTNEKLEMYQRQLANVQKEMSQSGEFSSTLANREEELKNKIANTEDAIAKKNQRLSEMRANLSEAGVDVNNLAGESQRLEAQMRELQKQEEQAASEAVNFGNSGVSAVEAVGSALATTGIAAWLNKVKESYTECVSAAMEFGGTMSTVEALSSASASEMAALSQSAKDYGANTVFTANQSASAMTYMGMAGWDATQMISGLPGVLNLAAASGEDLANTSDIVTDNLTAFNLKASDTTHFADVLAAAATNSNTSVGIMGETFKSSASIAGALGYSIEDVATAVGLMANAGVKGSVAGTALKNTFNGLLNGATLTAAAFGEVEFTAVNADGTMKDFGDTCNELRGYFSQMTEAERVQNAMLLAGQRGYNGLLAILNATDEDYQKVTDSINNCTGAAQRMADIKLDNLQGDVTLLNSAADGLKMTIGGMYDKELRQLAQFGTQVLGSVNEFCEQNPVLVKTMMAITAEVGVLVAGYTAFNAAKKIGTALKQLNTALMIKETAATVTQTAATGAATVAQTGLNTAMSLNPFGIVLTGIVGVTAAIGYFSGALESSEARVEEYTQAAIEMNEAMETAQTEFRDSETDMLATAATAEVYIDRLEEIEAATNGNVAENEEYHNTLALLSRTVPELADYIDLETNSIEGGTAALREYTEEWKKNAETQARQNYINALYDEYGDVIAEAQENSIKLTQAQIKRQDLEAKSLEAHNRMEELMAEAEKKAAETTLLVSDLLTDEYYELEAAAYGYETEITALKYEEADLTEAIERDNEAIAEAKTVIDNAQDAVDRLINSEKEGADSALNSVSSYEAVSVAIDAVSQNAEALIQSYNDAYQAAYESVSGQYALWDKAAEISGMDVGDINDSLSSQAKHWNTYNENLDKLLTKSDEIDGLREIIATFADGSNDSVNAIAGMADASEEDLALMVENWKKAQEAQEKAAGSLADVKVDFEERLNDIQTTMADTVEKMNLDDEAKQAAQATIQAYADGLLAGKGSVVEAADIISSAAASALASSAFDVTPQSGSSGGQPLPLLPMSALDQSLSGKYAVGTDNAAPGLALVGERGPELVNFNGGEQVLTADKTNALLSRASGGGGGNTITIAPVIQISGNADSETMQQTVDQIIERVEDALREAGIDARRGAYI
ncbi:MAG: phage tail tape measure protein [Oscillospiraceae bacterium]|nr:phage tail tape measure protein [Oscillospiraceae bacterium]